MLSPAEILQFWFGTLDAQGLATTEKMKAWFVSSKEYDQLLRRRFLTYVTLAAEAGLAEWEKTAEGRLALILLLDQFPRNIFRGTAMAFAYDAQARALCHAGLRSGADTQLPLLYRVFFYMPLEHSEKREDQAQVVALFEQLHATAKGALREHTAGFLNYAQQHCEIIERFGRFPHRNAVLKRPSTPEEKAYLDADARRFGQ